MIFCKGIIVKINGIAALSSSYFCILNLGTILNWFPSQLSNDLGCQLCFRYAIIYCRWLSDWLGNNNINNCRCKGIILLFTFHLFYWGTCHSFMFPVNLRFPYFQSIDCYPFYIWNRTNFSFIHNLCISFGKLHIIFIDLPAMVRYYVVQASPTHISLRLTLLNI